MEVGRGRRPGVRLHLPGGSTSELQVNNKRSEQTLRKTFRSETLHQKFASSWRKRGADSERTEGPDLFITGVKNKKQKKKKERLFDAPEKCTLADSTLISLLLLMDAITNRHQDGDAASLHKINERLQ